MKQLIRKILVLTIILSMLTSTFSQSVFATTTMNVDLNTEMTEEDAIEYARESYYNLSEEAKKVFKDQMNSDPELLNFHRRYVDKSYKTTRYEAASLFMYEEKNTKSYVSYSSTRGGNPLQTLEIELKRLALPSAVYYALMTLGTSVVVSLSDGGSITVTDFYALILAAGSVAVLTVYWDVVEPVYPQIVKAYKLSFADLITIIETAFLITKEDVQEEKAVARVETYVKKIQYKVSIFRARVNYGSGAIVEKSKGEMTVRQAVQRVMSGGDIYTLHKEIAKTMAWAIGSRNPSEHNKPSETDHFHCNPFFSKPHLFYGLRNIVYK